MSLFTQTVMGRCSKCGLEVSLNTLRSHDCQPKEPFPPRLWLPTDQKLLDELDRQFDISVPYRGDTQYLSLAEHLSLVREERAQLLRARIALAELQKLSPVYSFAFEKCLGEKAHGISADAVAEIDAFLKDARGDA